MTTRSRARETRTALGGPLQRHLPGLVSALDPDLVAEHVRTTLLRGDVNVEGATLGKLWWRTDRTLTLRYHLDLSDGDGHVTPCVVQGRVHQDDVAAESFAARCRTVRRSPARRGTAWRDAVTTVPGVGLSLHAFPHDPELPTLLDAVDPDVVQSLLGHATAPVVTVVHHPREGTCVLRYDEHDAVGATYYGKVYADGHGQVVESFLRELARGPVTGDSPTPLFPRPVRYVPSLRLLVTEALPGRALVPQLLKSVLGADHTGDPALDVAALRSAVRASALALAVLQRYDGPAAPVRTAADELGDLRRELAVVSPVWPETGDRVRRHLDALAAAVTAPDGRVLSHGDYTPSQVLLSATGPAVVDLDTLCWADPALDVGRYLVQLRLLTSKLGGGDAARLHDELRSSFLETYGLASPRAASQPPFSDRVAFSEGLSLARSALRACRQLKEHRLALTLSLLDQLDREGPA